jgi:hypothetical protein
METNKYVQPNCLALVLLFSFIFLCITIQSHGIAINNLRMEIEKAKDSIGDASQLEKKLKIAEEAVARGEKFLETREKQIEALKTEKAELEKLQLTLTSGLIGAVVTAIVAILGVVLKTFSSRAEKYLKDLEVIEKIAALKSKGVTLPAKFEKYYK